jgi:hypothetical protein
VKGVLIMNSEGRFSPYTSIQIDSCVSTQSWLTFNAMLSLATLTNATSLFWPNRNPYSIKFIRWRYRKLRCSGVTVGHQSSSCRSVRWMQQKFTPNCSFLYSLCSFQLRLQKFNIRSRKFTGENWDLLWHSLHSTLRFSIIFLHKCSAVLCIISQNFQHF